MPQYGSLKIVTGTSNPSLVQEIAAILDTPIVPAVVGRFKDGEVKALLGEGDESNIRDCDVFVVQSTNPPAENLIELFVLLDAVKRASPARVTIVFPYFGYACQDRKDRPRTPISAALFAKLYASLLEAPDRICCFDLHAAQIQGFFPIPRIDHIFLRRILVDDIRRRFAGENVVIVAPDVGAAKAARAYARRVGEELAVLDKHRDPVTGDITIRRVIGAEYVDGKHAVIVDDMIRGGDTVILGAAKLKEAGATAVSAYAAHGLLVGNACEALAAAPIAHVCVTDTVSIAEEKKTVLTEKITVIPSAPFIAKAIKRIHTGEGVSGMFDEPTDQ